MRGLSIVATGLDAAVLTVAAGSCAAASRAGLQAAPFVPFAVDEQGAAPQLAGLAAAAGVERGSLVAEELPPRATPLVAARHAGVELDPEELLRLGIAAAPEADVLISVLIGGPLAPVTPRSSVRDMARDFGAPVVVVADLRADGLAGTRAAVEALRAVGLGVSGIVLTGWPEVPDRVTQDERELLAELTGVDIATLADGGGDLASATDGWPLERWLEPPPVAHGASAVAATRTVALEPYVAWEETPVGDPRNTPRPELMSALVEIVAAEGPMLATRAFMLANRASGGRKLTAVVRAPLSSALHWLAQERRVVLVSEDEAPWQEDDIVRAPDSPEVVVRELGSRELIEIPLDEIAELMRRLRAARGLDDDDALKRAVLSSYGLGRLTARADRYLSTAIELLGD